MKTIQKGFFTPLLLAIIAILLIGGGAYVYVQNKQANQSADASLHFLGNRIGNPGYFNTPDSAYAVDSTYAYYDEKPFSADATTLEILKGSLTNMKGYISYKYARDIRTVYYAGEPLTEAVPATFQPIENGAGAHNYGTDGRTVYFGSKPIAGADPKTFSVLWFTIYEGCGGTHYSKDATHVYLSTFGTATSTVTTTVPNADPATFEALINGFGKDNRGYYNGATYIGPTLDKEKLVCNYG